MVVQRDVHPVLNRDVPTSFAVGVVLTTTSYVVGFLFGWIDSVNWLEATAVFTSYSCTYLCVKQRRFNYPIGAVSTAAYCLLFWQQGLYASMALNAYLTPALLYGWVRWRSDEATRPVTRVAARWVPVYALAAGIALVGGLAVNTAFGGSFAATDTIILVGSILAQFLLDNKKIETWLVWVAVDIIAVWQYIASGLFIAGVQYLFFLANAIWAFTLWRASMKAGRAL